MTDLHGYRMLEVLAESKTKLLLRARPERAAGSAERVLCSAGHPGRPSCVIGHLPVNEPI